jgi:hypothetical protein
MILEDEYKLCSSSFYNFPHSLVTSSLFGPNILLVTLFSNTLSLRSFLKVRDQVSHPYKTTGRIMAYVMVILTFIFLDRGREDKKTLNRIVAKFPKI